MRVITGKAKGKRLKSVPGDSTRPILDRMKENLFNILGNWVNGSRWLDLFAGTGSVGIEALSRGADFCLFVDSGRSAIKTIEENLKITDLTEGSEIRRDDAFTLISNGPGKWEAFEVIYVAPPQYKGLWKEAVEKIDARPEWLYPDGVVIAQIDPKEYVELELKNLVLYDQRTYGRTMILFYERPGD